MDDGGDLPRAGGRRRALADTGAHTLNESPVELPTAEQLAFESATLFASLAFGRLAEETRDLGQARLAIDALKALLDVLPEERRADLHSVLANLQLAYADAASAA